MITYTGSSATAGPSVQSDMSVWSYNNAFSASRSTLDASTSAKAIATAWQCLQKTLPEVPQDQKGG